MSASVAQLPQCTALAFSLKWEGKLDLAYLVQTRPADPEEVQREVQVISRAETNVSG